MQDYFDDYVFSPLTTFVSGVINIGTPEKVVGLPNQLLAQTDFPSFVGSETCGFSTSSLNLRSCSAEDFAMQTCSMTVQQLTTTNEICDIDSHFFPGSVGAILYEIAPGANFLSQQQISNVMRAASKHFKRGRASDVIIMVERDGTVSFRVENPGAVQI